MKPLGHDRTVCLRGARSGWTLLELLLVLGILAVVLGTGLGALAAADPGPERAVSAVRSVLRAAASAATARGEGARVRFDRAGSRLWLESSAVVGTWHFEGSLRGAFGLDGETRGVRWIDDGWLGRAIAFDGTSDSSAGVAVDAEPAFDPGLGFALELALRRDNSRGARVLELGSSIALEIGAAGDLRGRFALEPEKAGDPVPQAFVQSPPGMVTLERWTLVGFAYDGRRATLSIEGACVASTDVEGRVAEIDGPLVLSAPEQPFAGALDALCIRMRAAEVPLALARGVHFGDATPEVLELDGSGRPAADWHDGPVTIELVSERGRTRRLVFGPGGLTDG